MFGILYINPETLPLYQISNGNVIIGRLNAENDVKAKQVCGYHFQLDWRDLCCVELLRS